MPKRHADRLNHDSRASQRCDMLPWRFMVYVDAGGKSDVQAAIDRLDDSAAERFKAKVRHLSVSPREEWRRPVFAKLLGFNDLFELRFNDGEAVRPAGFFGPTPGVFTITLFVRKNRNGYDPKGGFSIADQRRNAVVAGTAKVKALQVHGEDFPPLRD